MSEFIFGTYVKPAKVNPYAEVVKELDKASKKDANASVTFPVSPESASNAVTLFRKAANDIDRTARLVNMEEDAIDGMADVLLTFTIGPRHKGGRGRKAKVA